MEIHNVVALTSDEDRASATGNMRKKFGEIWTCGFRDMRAVVQSNTQTRRHTDTADRNTSNIYRGQTNEKFTEKNPRWRTGLMFCR